MRNNNEIMDKAFNLANIIKGDIKNKADNICNNLNLIDNTLIESNNNDIDENIQKNENQNENIQYQIIKKKTNILISGKHYLEDKKDLIKIKSENINFKKKSNNLDLYNTHCLKDSKLSTENSTQNTHFKLIKKLDILPGKSNTNDQILSKKNKVYLNIK